MSACTTCGHELAPALGGMNHADPAHDDHYPTHNCQPPADGAPGDGWLCPACEHPWRATEYGHDNRGAPVLQWVELP